MHKLYSAWLDFKNIQEDLWKIDKKININYSPTIDQTIPPSKAVNEKLTVVFREQMIKIARMEIEFFKKNGRYLCSWFGVVNKRKICTAGLDMAIIDTVGNVYACHGALYSPNKEQLKSTTIFDDSLIDNIATFSIQFNKVLNTTNSKCKKCVATTCIICPVNCLDRSIANNFFDRWKDVLAVNRCEFFKIFGEIDRAVQEIIFKSNSGEIHGNLCD